MKDATAVLVTALELYQAGDLRGALDALAPLPGGDPLPDHPAWLATECERRAAHPEAPAVVSAAVRDWIDLARDRIRRELGEDVVSAVPVGLALRTAITMLRGSR